MTESLAVNETSRLISSEKVDGTAVYDRSGEKLGTIRSFMVDKVSGKADYAVLQFGGFFGIGSDYYPIPWNMLTYDTDLGGYAVDITREQIEDAPRYPENRTPAFDDSYGASVNSYWSAGGPVI